MTQEQLHAATQIKSELDRLVEIRSSIANAMRCRESEMKSTSKNSSHFDWLKKAFATIRLKSKDVAEVAVRYEFSPYIEFHIDEEFVAMMLEYFDKKIADKNKQLESL